VKQYRLVSVPELLALSWRLLLVAPPVGAVSRKYLFVVVPLGWMVIPADDPDEKGLRLELGIRLDPSPLIICVSRNGEPSLYVWAATD
jgi:hypothetical protein